MGKSTLADRLAKELRAPRLCSDVLGGSIDASLGPAIARSEAFRAGYDLLFRLCDQFLDDDCSVVVDCNMGWEFQWQRLDQIREKHPGVTWAPVILRCPLEVCRERLRLRHLADPDRHPSVKQFFDSNPQLGALWAYLEGLDRPDCVYVDASPCLSVTYAETLRQVQSRFARHGEAGGMILP